MGHQIERIKSKLFKRTDTPPMKRAQRTPDDSGSRPHSLRTPLHALVEKVAARSGDAAPSFDVEQTTSALRARIAGLELNLCKLTPDEKSFLSQLTADDAKQLHAAAALNGGEGIAYVELEGKDLPMVLAALQEFPNLDCVSVWAPEHGGKLDFSGLKCNEDGAPRIKILGTPADRLDIYVPEGLKPELSATHCPAMWRSHLHTRLNTGEVQTVALGAPSVARETVRLTPCAGDTALHATLVEQLRLVALHPRFRADPFEPNEVARAIVACAGFDNVDRSEFGFDFNALTAQQMRCLMSLPATAFDALKDSAAKAGARISWIDLGGRHYVTENFLSAKPRFPFSALLKMPCALDKELMDTLVAHLKEVAVQPNFQEHPLNPLRVARSLVLCGRIDKSGMLGFDLKKLTPQEVRCVQALPLRAWEALHHSASRTGLEATWLDLHDDFIVNEHLVNCMNKLSRVSMLSVSAPPRGFFIGLDRMHAGLKEVEIRPRGKKKFTIQLPSKNVKVRLPKHVDPKDRDWNEVLEASKVAFVGASGKLIGTRFLSYTHV